ncbi:MAG TPA: LacI family DNA-binding transcriptional regulator [Opitutaceae bacterium]|nr:LacI family DNA-binding transcriptional regulator [Opitutaceae bacterium]
MATFLGLSRTTVSDSLRNHPRVNASTRQLVQAHAREVGYRFNPLASSILSEVRRTRLSSFHGVLAVVSLEEPSRPKFAGPYWRDLLRGAGERAQELGFKLERFLVGAPGVSVHRLDTILQSRGIRGVLIMPAWDHPDFTRLDWKNYMGVYADYLIDSPALHSICPDHPRAMVTALDRLKALGYRRPGLVLQEQESLRLQHRWAGAFLGHVSLHSDFDAVVPPLVVPSISRESFVKWFKHHKPDVVLGHRVEIVSWMKECGARVPATHGFCCLNVSLNATTCAGIDQQPYQIGVHGIEIIIGGLHRNDYGIPELPCNTSVPPRWVDGPTLPAQVNAKSASTAHAAPAAPRATARRVKASD